MTAPIDSTSDRPGSDRPGSNRPNSDQQSSAEPPASRLLAYVQLLRLPNVFTAIADILMGYLFTHPTLDPLWQSLQLVLSSALIYLAGMVLNDVYDIEVDRAERPERPLPSGRIELGWARRLGYEMLFCGVGVSILLSAWGGGPRTALLAAALAALVVLYNRVLKFTPLGPVAMGGCRFLNVLLGMSLAAGPWIEPNYLVAGGIGLYIAGVTWFARSEADETIYRGQLLWAIVVMAGGLFLLWWFPQRMDPAELAAHYIPENWRLVWIVMSALIGWRCIRAIIQPHGEFIQEAVKQCIMSLVMLDALVSFAVRDFYGPMFIVPLLLPMTLLGIWAYST
jgi:4-hydroxybenzoate polyprenyltransferase